MEDQGYRFEIAHVNKCLREERKESPLITWKDTKDVLKQCDRLRKDWGLKYSQE